MLKVGDRVKIINYSQWWPVGHTATIVKLSAIFDYLVKLDDYSSELLVFEDEIEAIDTNPQT